MALSSYHRFLNPNSGTFDLFVCHVGPQSTLPLEDYIPTSRSLRLCSRQLTSPFSYLKCAVGLFSGACEALSAPGLVLLQVWSQESVSFILVCSAATREFLLTFGVLYANKIPTNRLWTTDGSLDIDLRWSYSRPRSGTIQLCVLLSWSVRHAQQDTCSGLMIS